MAGGGGPGAAPEVGDQRQDHQQLQKLLLPPTLAFSRAETLTVSRAGAARTLLSAARGTRAPSLSAEHRRRAPLSSSLAASFSCSLACSLSGSLASTTRARGQRRGPPAEQHLPGAGSLARATPLMGPSKASHSRVRGCSACKRGSRGRGWLAGRERGTCTRDEHQGRARGTCHGEGDVPGRGRGAKTCGQCSATFAESGAAAAASPAAATVESHPDHSLVVRI